MQEFMGLTAGRNFSEKYIKPLLEAGKIEMTIPDKPNSRNQKYQKVVKEYNAKPFVLIQLLVVQTKHVETVALLERQ